RDASGHLDRRVPICPLHRWSSGCSSLHPGSTSGWLERIRDFQPGSRQVRSDPRFWFASRPGTLVLDWRDWRNVCNDGKSWRGPDDGSALFVQPIFATSPVGAPSEWYCRALAVLTVSAHRSGPVLAEAQLWSALVRHKRQGV